MIKYFSFIPTSDKGGKWYRFKNVWIKGYAFLPSGRFLQKEELAFHIYQTIDLKNFSLKLTQLNGRFVATGFTQSVPFILSDRIRSFPLFYTSMEKGFKVSDNPFTLITELQTIDEAAKLQFLASGFTWEEKTLLKHIKQNEPSQIIFFQRNKTKIIKYFTYSTKQTTSYSEEEASKKLADILENVMRRALKVVGKNPIAVPLTSGYDSRFIVTWLTHNYNKKLITYTFGKPGSHEFENAQKVALQLNLEWTPVFHNKETIIKGFETFDQLNEYIDFTSGTFSIPFFQDFPSLSILNLSKDTIIFGGHSGDFIAGSHLWPFQNQMGKKLQLFYAFKKMFPYLNGNKLEKKKLKSILSNKYNTCKNSLPYSIIEEIDFTERQAKFIVNSCRNYDFFAKKALLPFFDNEFTDFFRSLPFNYKINKRIYDKTLKEYYFKPFALNFEKEFQATPKDYCKNLLKQSLPSIFTNKYNKIKTINDNCNYLYITKQISSNNFSIKKDFSHPNQLMIHWYLQYLEQKLHC
jgi:asparagine synthase (glutamine-hydrolysing)